MNRLSSIISIMAASTLVACVVTSRPPPERVTARSPRGYTAAEYALVTAQGDLGDVKIWSRGVRLMRAEGRTRTVAHVAFEVENNSRGPLELRELALDSATFDRRILTNIQPDRVIGATWVHPGETSVVNAYFALPVSISPEHVDAFRVRWRVEGNGVSYAERTPFMESPREQLVYYYTPNYDPFRYQRYHRHPRIVVYTYPYRHRPMRN
jgi:hypothetical protein